MKPHPNYAKSVRTTLSTTVPELELAKSILPYTDPKTKETALGISHLFRLLVRKAAKEKAAL